MRIIALLLFFGVNAIGQCLGQAALYDILITEMMIDPNPVIGLPNFEWVELYNHTDLTINLEGYQFSSGESRSALPNYDLPSGGFVMICDDDDQALLATFGPVIAITTFPSLTNGGDVARIESPDDELIHEVNYLRSWYGDAAKDDGGYTLEMINPEDQCLGSSNWAASEDTQGGTPAAINSIWNPKTPSAGLQTPTASILGTDQIQLVFTRIPSLDISEMDFSISPNNPVLDISIDIDDPRIVILSLTSVLEVSTIYTISVSADLVDCEGLASGMSTNVEVVRSAPIETNDFVINEVLFNPIGDESDYIEIYNRSNKFLNVNELFIGNLDPSGSGTSKSIGLSVVMRPLTYLVLTEDKSQLINRFVDADEDLIYEIDLPSMSNDAGNATLFKEENGQRFIIDAFDYDEGMHNTFIDDADGVALERIDSESITQNMDNWHSAASSTGYGTPSLINSQSNNLPISKDFIALKSKTFFPEGNQSDQILEILFSVDRPDYLGTIDIYDSAGHYIHQVANNQLLGRSDRYTWDGRSSSGVLQNAGVYIVFVRMVTAEGNLITKKLPCVLSRTL